MAATIMKIHFVDLDPTISYVVETKYPDQPDTAFHPVGVAPRHDDLQSAINRAAIVNSSSFHTRIVEETIQRRVIRSNHPN